MSTETEIAEVKEEKKASPESTPKDNEYKIFDYFKEHTGLFVTCVSALVAIMSFILHYAVGRMNYAYLAYWDIGSLHANISNQNELYTVVCSLLYLLSLMLIHSLLSGTSDTFRYYNKLLSTMRLSIKDSKKRKAKFRSKVQELSDQFEGLTPEEKLSESAIEAEKELERAKTILDESEDSTKELKSARNTLRRWVVIQLAVAVAFSYVIGFIFLALVNTTATIEGNLRSSQAVIVIILLDLTIYLLPAYFKSRCTGKKYENGDAIEEILEMIKTEVPSFPFESFVKNGVKSVLSDKKLKLVAWQIIAVTVILLFMMSAAGTMSAEQKREFPIFEDEFGAYAVVYTSGSTRFMEEATMSDGTIAIDTSKQRVITSDDISYHIEVFDNVSVIRIDDEEKIEQSKVSIDRLLDAIKGCFDALKTKIEEAMVDNEGSIPGTE